jgi:hypothetical protein
VLYTSGAQGDVTPIWSIDVDRVWRTHPGESARASLTRRETGFEQELKRLGDLLAGGVMSAIAGADQWDRAGRVSARRQQVALPLKAGYRRPTAVRVAAWQQDTPADHHLTEIQMLQLGSTAILGLPGEPFTSLGQAIRSRSPFRHLIITALSNDFGAISYIGDREAYELGGYELSLTPVAAGAGEILVEHAIALLGEV